MVSEMVQASQYHAEIVTTPGGLAALGPEWDALALRDSNASITQSHLWTTAAWEAIVSHSRQTPAIVTIRSGDRLVCVWPFFIQRSLFARRANAMAFGGIEAGGPLVDRCCDAAMLTELAWNTIRRAADFVSLFAIAEGSEIHSLVVKSQSHRMQISHTELGISFAGFTDFDSFLATQISAKGRTNFRRQTKLLKARGAVAFVKIENIEERSKAVAWMLDQKFRWMADKKISTRYLNSESFRNFMARVTADPKIGEIHLLTVDDLWIASWLNLASAHRIEAFMTTFDPRWAKYSPGLLIFMHCLRQDFDRRLDIDLKSGEFDYKLRFANRRTVKWEFRIATNWRGIPDLLRYRVRPIVLRARTVAGRIKRRLFARSKNAKP
jgi:CelD/BcsL family acetyltransferase involved in cellulose biosynthesis